MTNPLYAIEERLRRDDSAVVTREEVLEVIEAILTLQSQVRSIQNDLYDWDD